MLPMGDKITNERQARELAKIEPEHREEVLESVAADGPVTAKAIKAKVAARKPKVIEVEPEPERPAVVAGPVEPNMTKDDLPVLAETCHGCANDLDGFDPDLGDIANRLLLLVKWIRKIQEA